MWMVMAHFSDINSKCYKGKGKYDNFWNFQCGKRYKEEKYKLGNILSNIWKTINAQRKALQIPEKKDSNQTEKMCKAVNQKFTKEI